DYTDEHGWASSPFLFHPCYPRNRKRPVNTILHPRGARYDFLERRGTGFRSAGDGARTAAGCREGMVLAAPGEGVATQRPERRRVLRLAGAVGALVLCLAA